MIEAVLAAVFGLIIGSFLNVCIYRWPLDLSVMKPTRSFCPGCQKTIAWHDNVPVVSWAMLKGRCRECGARIPLRYPIVEASTAAAFAFGVYSLGITVPALKFCVMAAMLIALFFTDLEERILPDEFTIGGALAGVAIAYFVRIPGGLIELMLPIGWDRRWVSVIESAGSAVLLSGILWGIGELYYRLRHREGLGFGDVKMVGMLGSFLGLSGALFTLIVGSVLGSVFGLVFIYMAKKDAKTYELPFGSFLALAGLAVAIQAYPLAALRGQPLP